MAWQINGHVKQAGAPVARTVYVYSSVDGSKLGGVTSAANDGSYSVSVPDNTPVYVLCIPAAGYLPQVMGPITPVQV